MRTRDREGKLRRDVTSLNESLDQLHARYRGAARLRYEDRSKIDTLSQKVANLEVQVRGLERQASAIHQIYIKKDGYIDMRTRTALALQVAQNNASLSKAYSLVYSVLTNMLPDHTLVGHIESADAQIQAAVSSVAMTGRLVQFVRAWEIAAVVSGDKREMKGDGLWWKKGQRPSIENMMLFADDSQPPDVHGSDAADRGEEMRVRALVCDLSSLARVPYACLSGFDAYNAVQQETFARGERPGGGGSFLSLAFDGTSTWWGRSFVALAMAFTLGGMDLSNMVALLEKYFYSLFLCWFILLN